MKQEGEIPRTRLRSRGEEQVKIGAMKKEGRKCDQIKKEKTDIDGEEWSLYSPQNNEAFRGRNSD
jgi:hypothetical protein